ncbi:chemotaxis protein CheW [Tepidibacter hydrothermalis]|uniref:Chemotaxis protein CheW n=1 Tax=Tepidibacter hydrothermalis TaxID=3036126 RepID=A0ABY8EEA6_9FIRM|nr:chemotaxis protein CheW [Tepidibacter hydrothermalis]WFD11283.1 chemotaxis protein CheW [Tepidibacter hydrothermalis]
MEKCNEKGRFEITEILEFVISEDDSNQRYAIEIGYVNEVYSIKNVTMLPCTPAFIVGIMNFRGKIISVIDIRNFLGFTMKKVHEDKVKKVIVVNCDEIEVGIAVDGILGCRDIVLSEIQKNVLTITNFNTNYFKGITKERSIVLNIKNIMMDEKIIVNEDVI